jgi:hypothetical protein
MAVSAHAEIIFPYVSHLPRDTSVNTLFLISPDGTFDDMAAALAINLAGMYSGGVDGATHPLGAYLSNIIDRSICHLNLYDPSAPSGSPPAATAGFEVAASINSEDLPLQTALCVSMVGSNPSVATGATLPLKSRRGRNYIGPFNIIPLGADGAGGVGRPSSTLQADLVLAYNHLLANQIPGEGGSGVAIFSRKLGDAAIVTSGWVDNEWDTQRRRGVDPTVRNPLTVP